MTSATAHRARRAARLTLGTLINGAGALCLVGMLLTAL